MLQRFAEVRKPKEEWAREIEDWLGGPYMASVVWFRCPATWTRMTHESFENERTEPTLLSAFRWIALPGKAVSQNWTLLGNSLACSQFTCLL